MQRLRDRRVPNANINCSEKHGTDQTPVIIVPGQNNRLTLFIRHKLSKKEKLAYLDAEKCLMKLPATLGLPGTRTKFDELQAAHVMQAEWTHEVGAFLPFHRYMMRTHEQLLRKHCNYKGAQPYWYEQQDAGRIAQSVLLDPKYGFGGDGSGPENCIQDGPFKDYINGIGPFHQIRDHCIDRKLNNEASWMMAQSYIDYCYQFGDYEKFWWCVKGAVHFGGHAAIGLQLQNPISSPGDPLFYLHHTFLDKVWADWQLKAPRSRLYDIAGTNEQNPCLVFDKASFANGPRDRRSKLPYPPWPNGEFNFETFPNGTVAFPGMAPLLLPAGCVDGVNTWVPTPFPEGKKGDKGGNVTTLGHVLSMLGMVEDVTVGDVMDPGNEYLCYEYV